MTLTDAEMKRIDKRIADRVSVLCAARSSNAHEYELCVNAVTAALSDPTLRGETEWMTIESAPKDGKKVLVWNKWCGHWVASYRFPMTGEPQCEAHYVKEWRDGGGRWATPTLWMPLPPPPEEGL